ncbi:hypothetical protein SDRG_12018 [Saprolegnia diclina VS20]|uniref:Uncharacterized protein n=1 Tax=Saprolegnia diclina (strain VS20) TaxID=1156394 RepID=T0Q9K8_SAPDV|nr:hypothetical protein SDRG_12018 [Saprolegnia diclina VS20]EQC30165.1 hypothetical protein SDRG_12018 [Saprolegnia diclina VS20]|eukprot:XP_008616297.1 hypothetical protein SDRG_12018 [Saprolegnia diclina VS20]
MADAATAELLRAIAAGSLPRVRAALAAGADVNARDEDDATPLDMACENDRSDMVTCLLMHPRIDVAKARASLLVEVCRRGAGALVAQLLAHPTTDPMTRLEYGSNVLVELCSAGGTSAMLSRFMGHPRVDINASVDVRSLYNAECVEAVTPLRRAVEGHFWDNVAVLLQDPRLDVNAMLGNRTLLYHACVADKVDLVSDLLRRPGIDRSAMAASQGTAFAAAVRAGNTLLIELFLSLPHDDVNSGSHGKTPLVLAMQREHPNIAQRLVLEPHVDRHATDKNGNTVLHLACVKGWATLAETLLMSLDVHQRNHNGLTPASMAFQARHFDLALHLYRKYKADANVVMGTGMTPLQWACHDGRYEVIQALLALPLHDRAAQDNNSALMLACRGPPFSMPFRDISDNEVAHRNSLGHTLVHVACAYGQVSVVAALLPYIKQGSINARDNDGNTPLHLAVNHEAVVTQLLAVPEVDLKRTNKLGRTVLHVACASGQGSVVALLLRAGATIQAVDREGNTPLMLACTHNHVAVVMQLLSQPPLADETLKMQDGRSALHVAARAGHVRLLRWLLESTTTDVNGCSATGTTALMEAVDHRKPGVVTYLLRHSAVHVNATDSDGNTALMRLCMRADYDILEILLSHPAIDINRRNHLLSSPEIDVNYRDASGLTALLQVCLNQGNVKIVQLLLEKPEIDTSVRDKHGNSALLLATRQGNPGIVQALLAHGGCDVNAANDSGTTALHAASGSKHAGRLVPLLLGVDRIDVNAMNKKRQTPLMLACLAGDVHVASLLLDHPRMAVGTTPNGPLPIAVRLNNISLVTPLVQHPTTNAEIADEAGLTPWLRAVNSQNVSLVQALAARIDVNKALVVPDRPRDDNDSTLAWMEAMEPDSLAAANLRYMNPKVEWVASTNRHECTDATVASCKTGKTALMVACLYSNEAMVECLLSQPTINVNAVDDDGNTALMHVAFLHPTAERIWHRLCQNTRLDVTMTNTQGETAIEIAGRCGSGIATAYLLQQLLSRRHPSVLPEIVEAVAAFFVDHGRLERAAVYDSDENDWSELELDDADDLDGDDDDDAQDLIE